jgi:hypothetical protein
MYVTGGAYSRHAPSRGQKKKLLGAASLCDVYFMSESRLESESCLSATLLFSFQEDTLFGPLQCLAALYTCPELSGPSHRF